MALASYDLLGQDQVLRALMRARAGQRLAHAFAFVGASGVGKLRVARAFAAMLLSGEDDLARAAEHPVGRRVLAGTHPDVHVAQPPPDKRIFPRAAVMELLERLYRKPFESALKVAIVVQAHAMNAEAANAFLKSLEEPPEETVLLLLVDDWNALLPTIQSRVQPVRFRPLDEDDMTRAVDVLRDELAAAQAAEAEAAERASQEAAARGKGKTKRAVKAKKTVKKKKVDDAVDRPAVPVEVTPYLAMALGSPGMVRDLATDRFLNARAIVASLVAGSSADPVAAADDLLAATQRPEDETLDPQRRRLKQIARLAALWCRDAAVAGGDDDAPALDVDAWPTIAAVQRRRDAVDWIERGHQFFELCETLDRNVNPKLWTQVFCNRLAALRSA